MGQLVLSTALHNACLVFDASCMCHAHAWCDVYSGCQLGCQHRSHVRCVSSICGCAGAGTVHRGTVPAPTVHVSLCCGAVSAFKCREPHSRCVNFRACRHGQTNVWVATSSVWHSLQLASTSGMLHWLGHLRDSACPHVRMSETSLLMCGV